MSALATGYAHPASSRSLQRQRLELGRQIARGGLGVQPQVAPLVPARLIPQLEPIALTDQHSMAPELRELAQLGWQQEPPVPVERQIRRIADHQPLQPARGRVQRRQAHQLAFGHFAFTKTYVEGLMSKTTVSQSREAHSLLTISGLPNELYTVVRRKLRRVRRFRPRTHAGSTRCAARRRAAPPPR